MATYVELEAAAREGLVAAMKALRLENIKLKHEQAAPAAEVSTDAEDDGEEEQPRKKRRGGGRAPCSCEKDPATKQVTVQDPECSWHRSKT